MKDCREKGRGEFRNRKAQERDVMNAERTQTINRNMQRITQQISG